MAGTPIQALVVGLGGRAANGLTAVQVATSIRARRLWVRESRFRDRAGEPIGLCHLACIDPAAAWTDRLIALARPAFLQATFELRAAHPGLAVPVFLALAERERPGFDPNAPRLLLDRLEATTGQVVDHARSRVFTTGRAGGAKALAAAGDALAAGAPIAIVGGVDSYHDADALDGLERELRLHSMEIENGFIPGEGAAFFVLVRPDAMGALVPRGRVLSVGLGDEPHPLGSSEPCLGVGATTAVREALDAARLGPRGIFHTASDLQNERHRVDEWLFARARNHEGIVREAVDEQPLLVTGDLGAASLAMLVVQSVVAWEMGTLSPGPRCLGVHSDGPPRGAAVVARA